MTNHGNLLSITGTRGKKGLELIRFISYYGTNHNSKRSPIPNKKGEKEPPPTMEVKS